MVPPGTCSRGTSPHGRGRLRATDLGGQRPTTPAGPPLCGLQSRPLDSVQRPDGFIRAARVCGLCESARRSGTRPYVGHPAVVVPTPGATSVSQGCYDEEPRWPCDDRSPPGDSLHLLSQRSPPSERLTATAGAPLRAPTRPHRSAERPITMQQWMDRPGRSRAQRLRRAGCRP